MDDLISRQAAIDWIKGWFDTDKHYHPYSKGKTIPTCEVMDILERVPSAEPQYTEQDMRDQFNAGYACGMEAAQPETHEKRTETSSAQPEIIHCNSCKHWTQSTGKMKGYGLGRCDFHGANLVTCNGFCYWAERRIDG